MLALCYFTLVDLVHDRWRSLLTLVSLAVIVVGYLLLTSLSQALLALTAQAQVTNNLLILESDVIDPMDSSLNEDILRTAVTIAPAEIQDAFPLLFRHLTIDKQLMQVRAVAPAEMSTSVGLTLLKGEWPLEPRQVVVSQGAASLASWNIGSQINIYGTNFQISGIVQTDENAFGSAWMTYTEGLQLFGSQRGFQVGYLSITPSSDPQSVRIKLLADPRIAGGYSVYLENTFTDSYNGSNKNLVILSSLMVLVSLLVITFGTYNAASLSLTERSLEIGLLTVIGFTRGKLRLILLVRILLLTLIAYGLGWLASAVFIRRQQLDASVDLIFRSIQMTPFSAIFGLLLALLFACVGAWLATRRLATLEPLLRSE